ncbi:hypothetical protein [Caldisphaera sp.]|uniref:hypothetical protein n=1 Tax=Caldisphaera sp. TaxID=2060322 RepID=UPI0025BE3DED|nr:hypothetical protein [Caldisphaera sp.]
MDKTDDYIKVFDKLIVHEVSLIFKEIPKVALRQIILNNKKVLKELERELKELNFLNKIVIENQYLDMLGIKITIVRIAIYDKIDTEKIEKVIFDQFLMDPYLFDIKSLEYDDHVEILLYLFRYRSKNKLSTVLLSYY